MKFKSVFSILAETVGGKREGGKREGERGGEVRMTMEDEGPGGLVLIIKPCASAHVLAIQ